MDASVGFDRAYAAVAGSAVYREAVHTAIPDLPEWLVPYSVTSIPDLRRIADELHITAGHSLLDLACGTGGPGIWLAEQIGCALTGVDFAPTAIAEAQKLAQKRGVDRAHFIVADIANTGLPNCAFDGVVCLDALQFVDAYRASREIARLLRGNGVAVIRLWEALVPDLPLQTILDDYRPVFEAAGFTVRVREEVPAFRERELAFYRAIVERSNAFRLEAGNACESILEESREMLARADAPARVQKALYVLDKS